jgi:hypothetical protein
MMVIRGNEIQPSKFLKGVVAGHRSCNPIVQQNSFPINVQLEKTTWKTINSIFLKWIVQG